MFGKQESKDSHILCALIPTTSDSSCSRSGFLGLHHPVLQVPSLRLLQVIIRGREGCWIPRLEIFTGMLPLIQCAGIGAVCGSQCLQGTSWIGPWATGASRAQGTSLNLLSVQGKHWQWNWWTWALIYPLGWFVRCFKKWETILEISMWLLCAAGFAQFRGSHSTWSLTWEENLQPINMC